MKSIGLLLALAAVLALSRASRAESPEAKNNQGNRLFAEGNYREAEKAYIDAQVSAPGKPEILYNLGNALIKQNKQEKGFQALRQAISKGDKTIAKNGWFNAGNALFSQSRYREAVEAYTQTLRIDPTDRDAKHNLEMALGRMKEPQQHGEKGKPRETDDKASNDKSAGQNHPSPQQQQGQSGKDQPGSGRGSGGDRDAHGSAPRPMGTMTKEQALQLLKALENQEVEARRGRIEQRAAEGSHGRDW